MTPFYKLDKEIRFMDKNWLIVKLGRPPHPHLEVYVKVYVNALWALLKMFSEHLCV